MVQKIFNLFLLFLLSTNISFAQSTQPSSSNPVASQSAASQPETPEEIENAEWPKEYTSGKTKLRMYQPQIDSWDGFNLEAHSALGINPNGGADYTTFGVVFFKAHTLVDKESRQATLQDVIVKETSFPSDKDQESNYAKLVTDTFAKKSSSTMISLDRLQESFSEEQIQQASKSVEIQNTPPAVIFSNHPALLVTIDGDPVFQEIKGTTAQRIVNTHVALFKDTSGKLYLKVFDGWMMAGGLKEKWTVEKNPPAPVLNAYATIKDSNVDPLQGGNPDDSTSLPKLADSVPEIIIATEPTELIVTDGEPNYLPVEGTQLLYVDNTSANVFKDLKTQQTYILISGRWFSAASIKGPWTFIPNNQLPKDFAAIPDTSEKENVKASVAGTDQSREALIDNSIPQTAKISRKEARLTKAGCDGNPDFAPIDRTQLDSAQNCARPLIRSGNTYFTLDNGVWFVSNSPAGPWSVADKIPADIYSIPTSHPLHYVTYVRIYDSTPEYVYVGYTPGYYGSYVGNGVVVYGTGYRYRPWVRSAWYGYPWTYGFGVGIGYTPWTGWGWGFGYGWRWTGPTVIVGWGWGVHPWWGPYRYYGPGRYRWYGYNRSVYRRWNSRTVIRVNTVTRTTSTTWQTRTALSYNSRNGRIIAGQKAKMTNAYGNDHRNNSVGNLNPNNRDNTTQKQNENKPQNLGREANEKNQNAGTNNHNKDQKQNEPQEAKNLGRAANENQRAGNNNNNNVYGNRDGVFRSKDDGGWEQRGQGNKWEDVQDTNRIQNLERERNARQRGEERSNRSRQFMKNERSETRNDRGRDSIRGNGRSRR